MYFVASTRFLDAAGRRNVTIVRHFFSAGRPFVSYALAFFLSAILLAPTTAAEKYNLQPSSQVGDLQRIRTIVEVKGELKLRDESDPDRKKVRSLPLQVTGDLLYDEKNLPTDNTKLRRKTARYYHQAHADIRAGSHRLHPRLGEARRLIVVQIDKDRSTLYCPKASLTREDLDLIDVQGSSALLPLLLPRESIAVGESWELDEKDLALLLGLDIVNQAEIKNTLASVEENTAIVTFAGTVDGAVGGVASEIEFQAKMNVDLAKKRIAWLTMAIEEKRAIGHAEPGFEVVARIRLSTLPLAESKQLDSKALADLPAQIDPSTAAINFESTAGGFRVLHDRRWRVMVDRRDVTILRLVDSDDVIAQCNISRLPDLEKGKQVQLTGFQQEVQRALSKNFGQFVEASQSVNGNGLQILKVIVQGISSDLPVQWNYYHVSNEKGYRATYVFTLEGNLVKRFANADQLLTRSFELLRSENPNAGKSPTPAAKTSKVNDKETSRQ